MCVCMCVCVCGGGDVKVMFKSMDVSKLSYPDTPSSAASVAHDMWEEPVSLPLLLALPLAAGLPAPQKDSLASKSSECVVGGVGRV